MAAVEVWCRIRLVDPDGVELALGALQGRGAPDLGHVDGLARLALAARRLGADIVVSELSPALRELLELAGLRVEVEG
jgi:hypothetical protein